MRVLYDATWIGKSKPGNMHGGLRVTDRHIDGLHKRLGNELTLTHTSLDPVTSHGLRVNASSLYDSNIQILDRKLLITRLAKQFDKLLSDNLATQRLKNLVPFLSAKNLSQFDIYQSSFDPFPKAVSENKKIKKFIIVYDLIPRLFPEQIPESFLKFTNSILASLGKDSHIMTISESTRQDLLRFHPGLSSEQVRVNYIAADKHVFFKEENESGLAAFWKKNQLEVGKYIFTLNALAPYKNLVHTIEAFTEVQENGDLTDHSLLVVGKWRDKSFKEKLLVQFAGSPKVVFLEYVSDDELRMLYNHAQCFVYMSLYEGFGLPILEAMQCGCPVICSNASSMPEVAGDAGIVINPYEKKDLMDAMTGLLADDNKRVRLSNQGLLRSEGFSWDNFADNTISYYKEVLPAYGQ